MLLIRYWGRRPETTRKTGEEESGLWEETRRCAGNFPYMGLFCSLEEWEGINGFRSGRVDHILIWFMGTPFEDNLIGRFAGKSGLAEMWKIKRECFFNAPFHFHDLLYSFILFFRDTKPILSSSSYHSPNINSLDTVYVSYSYVDQFPQTIPLPHKIFTFFFKFYFFFCGRSRSTW